ncbi:DUF3604 domain-containing protein [Ovoidimarina sediminis]|uniref:DUF3604 domain-containing protein n=1 Tax=Ovoidimarina sediminis TaxID=3079856 RepID=UPI00290D80CD|nr:DUF3604 domain-containing protein [Rhodophyticola sp. MJ-SS7]MDU8944286.1 DUF3604 domain-containing protein [Rhodophyticola sp. MJ-SS7]
MRKSLAFVSVSFAGLIVCTQVIAQELGHSIPDREIEYSPYLQEDFPNQVFFGDTHLHTAFSADAGLVGATTTPDDAFRFAKGEQVISSNGIPARLRRPLDFLVVTDHAENLGIPAALAEEDPVLTDTEWGAQLAEIAAPGTEEAKIASYEFWMRATFAGEDPLAGTPFGQTMWEKATEAAERHNDPGAFTAFIGFEWTSQPNGSNMHRNIIYRDGKDLADQKVPISSYDSDDPEVLWDWMEDYQTATGGRMLAIPHGGNLSNGLMFDDITLSGEPLTAAYAQRRMQYEPLYEITQMKGDGEAHPMLSVDDEFAHYGTWDKGSFGPDPKTPDMLPKEYARSAWMRGLTYEANLGSNPFKFGVVGSTDAHTGLSTATEDNFFGKVALVEPTGDPIRYNETITGRATPDPSDDLTHADALASGIAAVWARENTREALFDAMERKEVYATTGTRLRVRVFGGWEFTAEDMNRSDFAAYGYEAGVPMGGDMSSAPDGAAPGFLIQALRDPDGANLDRIQVIKGWTTAEGPQERVYDVVWSGDRTPGANGKLPPVGDTVDAGTAGYSNTIGAPFLAAFWQDPDFDASQRAFYYVRVIEIPTPRWTTYDSVFFGVDLPEGMDVSQQERAYTSPIWYTPS